MSERQGMNNTHLKNRNRGLTLQLIASGQQLSRADISKRIGLTKMTVTNIVNELIAAGYVEEKNIAEKSAVGRNPVLLDIAPHAPKALGVYLSRESISVILTDLKLQVLDSRTSKLRDETNESLKKKLLRLIHKVAASTSDPLIGIGVSTIGPLDANNRILLNPTNFFGISNFPIAAILEKTFELPIFVNNDMNAAALAERLYGFGRPLENFIYLGLSNGVGSGIISGGHLFRDNNGSVGEIGHTCINFQGPACTCGNRGCLEAYVNMPVILEKLKQASGLEKITYDDFTLLMRHPDGDAIFQDMVEKLSVALVNVVNLLDPQCIIIGHEGTYLPELYVKKLELLVNAHILSAGYKQVLIIKSIFGQDAPLYGSVCCIFQEIFAGRMV